MSQDDRSPVPVALFAYVRPWHLQQTLAGLKANHVPLIYAFSDGPRTPDKVALVQEVRQVLHAVDWCEIHRVEREQNLGLGPSIRAGVSAVLEQYDRLIVVEDDIVLRPGAYDYTVQALREYENHPEVMTISMWSRPALVPRNAVGGFFSKRFVCWGWATYRHEWQKYIGTPVELFEQCKQQRIDPLMWGKDIQWQVEHSVEKRLWYVGYALVHFLHQKVSYFPNETLTVNIGRDGSGENVGRTLEHEAENLIDVPVKITKLWPEVNVVAGLDKQFAAYFDPKYPGLWQRIRNFLGRLRRMLIPGFVKGK